jgi:hypothetical protein
MVGPLGRPLAGKAVTLEDLREDFLAHCEALLVVQVAGLDDPAVEGCFELGESASAEPDLGSGEFHLVPINAADPSLLYPAGSGERAGGRVPRAESLVSLSRSVGRRA